MEMSELLEAYSSAKKTVKLGGEQAKGRRNVVTYFSAAISAKHPARASKLKEELFAVSIKPYTYMQVTLPLSDIRGDRRGNRRGERSGDKRNLVECCEILQQAKPILQERDYEKGCKMLYVGALVHEMRGGVRAMDVMVEYGKHVCNVLSSVHNKGIDELEDRRLIRAHVIPLLNCIWVKVQKISGGDISSAARAIAEGTCLHCIAVTHFLLEDNHKTEETCKNAIRLLQQKLPRTYTRYQYYGHLQLFCGYALMKRKKVEEATTYHFQAMSAYRQAQDFCSERERKELLALQMPVEWVDEAP